MKTKLSADSPAATALNNLTASQGKAEAVTEVARGVSAQLESDIAAKEELHRLLAAAGQDGAVGGFVVQVMDGTKVGKIVSIGTVIGDVTF